MATGAHRGWTKTQVATITVDEITGIAGRSYEKQFVAGVEFLGAGLPGRPFQAVEVAWAGEA
jgi:hypothetical protein